MPWRVAFPVPCPAIVTDLTAGEWAVLALLAEAPSHGFALARAMGPDGDVGRVWSVRRPLVYRAVDTLTGDGPRAPRRDRPRARPARAAPSSRPRRTASARSPGWLGTPVEHVRDGRSLLMLKLLFLARRDADPSALLGAQREVFAALAVRLTRRRGRGRGLRSRARALAARDRRPPRLRFVETMLHAAGAERDARRPRGRAGVAVGRQ